MASIIDIMEQLYDEGLLELPKGNEESELAYTFIRPSKKAKDIARRVRIRVLMKLGWVEITQNE